MQSFNRTTYARLHLGPQPTPHTNNSCFTGDFSTTLQIFSVGVPTPPYKQNMARELQTHWHLPPPPSFTNYISKSFHPEKKLLEGLILPKETCFIASILGEESVID